MGYKEWAQFAQQGGAVYFFLIFLGGCVYAYWPKKKAEFDHAARLPLDEES